MRYSGWPVKSALQLEALSTSRDVTVTLAA
jgi:hypothetical protein